MQWYKARVNGKNSFFKKFLISIQSRWILLQKKLNISRISPKLIICINIFLIAVVPLLTSGLDIFEDSILFNFFSSSDDLERLIYANFSTQYDVPKQTAIQRKERLSFSLIWNFAKKYNKRLPQVEPEIITRYAVHNAPYIKMPPSGKETYLIPDSIPILASYCSFDDIDNKRCAGDKILILGTVDDFKRWLETDKRKNRIIVNIILSSISVFLGLLILFYRQKQSQ